MARVLARTWGPRWFTCRRLALAPRRGVGGDWATPSRTPRGFPFTSSLPATDRGKPMSGSPERQRPRIELFKAGTRAVVILPPGWAEEVRAFLGRWDVRLANPPEALG